MTGDDVVYEGEFRLQEFEAEGGWLEPPQMTLTFYGEVGSGKKLALTLPEIRMMSDDLGQMYQVTITKKGDD